MTEEKQTFDSEQVVSNVSNEAQKGAKVVEMKESSPDGGSEKTLVEREDSGKNTEEVQMEWYILKVQSNREDSIKKTLERRVRIAGLDKYFGEIVVPTESVTELKGGRRKTTKQKLYPGYVIIQMEINEDTWYLVRQTSGVGDFAGAGGKPTPMMPHEVEKIMALSETKEEEEPKFKIGFKVGDQVKVIEGNFESYEGEVSNLDLANGRVTVMINIFGRSTPVELEYWQIESN
ncbi:MAG: transcription termination/antitermination protein NusG [Planctomycetia bacterium]|nr:transcription termination/antitermination protein NusG [Planctomycetia bacterium]